MKRICVFCGAAAGSQPTYEDAAARLGTLLADRGHVLVYGAGRTGLMGALARAALQGGGEVVGVVPASLNTPDLVHGSLTRLHVVSNLQERKAVMHELADAFIALPGGYGTFDELLDVVASAQLAFHHKPIGLLNTSGYFAPLLEQIDLAVREGFVSTEERRLIVAGQDPSALLDAVTRPTG